MATITKRGKAWQVKIRRQGWPSRSATFDRKAEAQAWADEVESQMRRGVLVDTDEALRTSVGDLFARYREQVSSKKRGADVEQARLLAWERSHPLREYAVAHVKSHHVAQWRDERLQQVTPDTVIRELGLLHHIFEHAAKEWNIHLPANPASAKLVARPARPHPEGRDRRLHDGEESALLEAAAQGGERGARVPWLRPVIVLAIETAMRRGELLALRWEHINLESRVARLPAAATKTTTGRAIPLSTRALEALDELAPKARGPVVPASANALKQAWERTVQRARREYMVRCERLGVIPDSELFDDLRFHDLRHEATSRLFEKGLDLMEVASITGHRDLRMLRRYTHHKAAKLVEKIG